MIKTCPRCYGKDGRPEVVTEDVEDIGWCYRVECPCGACSGTYGGFDAENEAIESWNDGEIFPNQPIDLDKLRDWK